MSQLVLWQKNKFKKGFGGEHKNTVFSLVQKSCVVFKAMLNDTVIWQKSVLGLERAVLVLSPLGQLKNRSYLNK